MRSCEWVREQLKAFVDGECGWLARARIQRHLRGCAACRDESDALARIGDALRSGTLAQPPAALRSRILEALPEHEEWRTAPRPRSRWVPLGAVTVGAAAVALVVGFLWHPADTMQTAMYKAVPGASSERGKLELSMPERPQEDARLIGPPESARPAPPPLLMSHGPSAVMKSARPGVAPVPPSSIGLRPISPVQPAVTAGAPGPAGEPGSASRPRATETAGNRSMDAFAKRAPEREAVGRAVSGDAMRAGAAIDATTPAPAGYSGQGGRVADLARPAAATPGLGDAYASAAAKTADAPPAGQMRASAARTKDAGAVANSTDRSTSRALSVGQMSGSGGEAGVTSNAAAEAPIELRVARLDYTLARIRDRVREDGGAVKRRRRRRLSDGSRLVTLTVRVPSDRAAAVRAHLAQLAPAQAAQVQSVNGIAVNSQAKANTGAYGAANRAGGADLRRDTIQDKPSVAQDRTMQGARRAGSFNLQGQNNGAQQRNAANGQNAAPQTQQTNANRQNVALQTQQNGHASAETYVTLTIVLREIIPGSAERSR